GLITVHNLFDFTNLDQYDFKWELYKNGDKVKEGTFALNLAPHQQKDVKLSLPVMSAASGEEYFVNVFAFTKKASELVPSGHEVAREQFKAGGDYFAAAGKGGSDKLEVKKEGDKLSFKAGGISGEFDLRRGVLSRYALNNSSPVMQFPEPYFWRAP